MPSSWAILGLTAGTPIDDVKRQYKRLALRHHPDKNPGSQELATQKMMELQQAFEKILQGLESKSPNPTTMVPQANPRPKPQPQAYYPFSYTRPQVFTDWKYADGRAERSKRKEKPKPQKGPKGQGKFQGSSSQPSTPTKPSHPAFKAMTKLCQDEMGCAVLAEARADASRHRYQTQGRAHYYTLINLIFSKTTLLREHAETSKSRIQARHISTLADTDKDKWWDQLHSLTKTYEDVLARYRQASQLETWLGELSDSQENSDRTIATDSELDSTQRIAAFAHRIKGL